MRICQLYVPAFFRSYGKNAIKEIKNLLWNIKVARFSGIYLIAIWEDGGYDNGFDVVRYHVNPKFGTEEEFMDLIKKAHGLGLVIGVDVVPNHVSDKNELAKNCLNNVPGYEDCLYVVTEAKAKYLTKIGVPIIFGKLAYSDFGDKYVRSTFADYHQLNLNWNSKKVQKYFKEVFRRLKSIGINFVRVDCGMMLLEDVTKADKNNPMACMRPRASIEALRKVSGGMPMFFEWFDPKSADLFDDLPECYALDCSYVMTGRLNPIWKHRKLVPLLGGHDQMTLADRGFSFEEILKRPNKSGHIFLDMQTLLGWKTDPAVTPEDLEYDADINNRNQRYRARRPIAPVVDRFKQNYH